MLAVVKKEWPGNAAPVVRGNKENMVCLDKLVEALTDCHYKPATISGVMAPEL